MKKVDLVKALELFRYLQNYQSYGLGSAILLSTGNGNGPGHTWGRICDRREKLIL